MSDWNEFTIVFVGDGAVGKSCFIKQYVNGRYIEGYDPTAEDTYSKIVEIDRKRVALNLIDTAGQEDYRSLADACIVRAHGVVLGYSITCKSTFESLEGWMRTIKSNAPKEIPVMLVGNKIDSEYKRQVSYEDGLKFAKENGIELFFESKHLFDLI